MKVMNDTMEYSAEYARGNEQHKKASYTAKYNDAKWQDLRGAADAAFSSLTLVKSTDRIHYWVTRGKDGQFAGVILNKMAEDGRSFVTVGLGSDTAGSITFPTALGNLAGFTDAERVAAQEMPELEQWLLHRLAELDTEVRQGYAKYDFQGVFQKLFTFATTDLSAFYFDVRKDSLYCDAPTNLTRRSARTVLDLLFRHLTTWLAPILVFTMEEVWLCRFPGDTSSVHLEDMPETPKAWLNPGLAAKWETIRAARRVVTGALEVQRTAKVIGASLEADPVVHVADTAMLTALKSVNFADLCITSGLQLTQADAPETAFHLADVAGIGVVFERAQGSKCERCWRVLPEVGHQKHPHTCARCSAALG